MTILSNVVSYRYSSTKSILLYEQRKQFISKRTAPISATFNTEPSWFLPKTYFTLDFHHLAPVRDGNGLPEFCSCRVMCLHKDYIIMHCFVCCNYVHPSRYRNITCILSVTCWISEPSTVETGSYSKAKIRYILFTLSRSSIDRLLMEEILQQLGCKNPFSFRSIAVVTGFLELKFKPQTLKWGRCMHLPT